MNTDLDKKIEAILFYQNDSLSVEEICKIVEAEKEEVVEALNILENKLSERGVVLVRKDGEFSLATSSAYSSIIEKMVKMEMNRELSSASLETLSIILYKSPISKKEIEYIRGVNSTFSIRNLLLRGLIEREQSRLDERVYFYKPSKDLFLHLGISKIEEMPEWNELKKELEISLNQNNKTDTEDINETDE